MNQKCKPKKRICITISQETLDELDILKKETYSKSRSEVIDQLIKEKKDSIIKQ